MKFKVYEYTKIENVYDFYKFWNFVEKNTDADIEEYYINGGDNEPEIKEDGVFIEVLWIKPRVVSIENLENIMKLLNYIEKYSNIEYSIVDINVK